jgi:hypothetical protein
MATSVLETNTDGHYAPAQESMYFPGFPIHEIAGFVQRRSEVDQLTLNSEFRAWVRECRSRSANGNP